MQSNSNMRLTRREYFYYMGLKVLFRVLFFSWSELPRSVFYLSGCLQYSWVFARVDLQRIFIRLFFQVQLLWKPWICCFVQLCWNRISLSTSRSDSSNFCTCIVLAESIILFKGASMQGTLCIPFQSSINRTYVLTITSFVWM